MTFLYRIMFILTLMCWFRFTIDLGSTARTAGRHEVIIGDKLADNRWHSIKVERSQTTIVLTLDSVEQSTTTPGSFVRLDLDKFIYVGGLDRSVAGDFHGSRNTPNFIGCLRDVYFDFIDILYGAQYQLLYYSTPSKLGYACAPDDYHPVGFPTGESHLMVSDSSPNNLTFSLSFRSYTGNGIIASRISQHARVYVGLVSGTLVLEVIINSDPPIKISVGDNLDDGMWHDVSSGVNHGDLWLLLDDKPEVRHSNPRLRGLGNFRTRVYIGRGTQRAGFVGCMQHVVINGVKINPQNLRSGLVGAKVDQCNIKSLCFPNPCSNGGTCKQYEDKYTCDCTGIFYQGQHCEIPLYRATCAEYKALGISENSYCTVDPDGEGPLHAFEVLCNVTSSDTASSIITHDKQVRNVYTMILCARENTWFLLQLFLDTYGPFIKAVITAAISNNRFLS